ncbi:MAG: hypothetical protein U0325_20915 [Polyangiales bacterium]
MAARTTTAPVPVPAPVAPPPAPPARPAPDRVTALRAALPVLRRALPGLEDAPADAAATLRETDAPPARAWSAYLAHHAGDDAGAATILAALARDGETPEVDDDVTDPAVRALTLIRQHAELLDGGDDDVVERLPCVVFAWDPAAAARAFGPLHGSTRDALVAPFKRRCVAEALGRAMPARDAARAGAAVDAVSRALFRAWPQPDGTVWTAAAISAREALDEPLLGVEGEPVAAQDAAAQALVAQLGRESPELLAPLMAYRRAAQGHIDALARGICAVSQARGRPLRAGQCERRAYTATLAAFTRWVGPRRGME